MKKPMKAFFTAVDLHKAMEANEGKLPEQIEVLRADSYKNTFYGSFTITNSDLDEFVANFDSGVYSHGDDGSDKDLPVNLRHDRGGEAAGWIKSLSHAGDGILKAMVDWTKIGKEKLAERLYRYISPEWHFEYVDQETGNQAANVLVGAGLTNIPLFKKLAPLTADESNAILFTAEKQLNKSESTMKLENIVAKEAKTLTADEISFLKENVDKLTDEQKETFKDVLKASEPKKKEPKKGDDPAPKGYVSAEEHDKLKVQIGKLQDQVDMQATEKEVDLMIASEGNPGAILRKQKDAVVTFMASLTNEQKEQFKAIMGSFPKLDIYKEMGDNDNNLTGNPDAKVLKLAEAKMKETKGMTLKEATKAVLKENPELAEEYRGK